MAGVQFENLVDMAVKSIAAYGHKRLFGVKKQGRYGWVTYREIGEQIDQFRAGLASLGVGKGDRVAVIANNRPEWAVGAYATYGLIAQYVPMYEAQLEKDWKYILEDSGAKVLLVANQDIYDRTTGFVDEIETLEHVLNFEGKADDNTSYQGLLAIGGEAPVDPVMPETDDIAGFIYTSGTTGNPKGVLLSHGNFISNVNALHASLDFEADDVSLSFLPWAHSFGQTIELHSMLSYGCSIALAESVQTIVDNLLEVRPTLLISVPRIFNRIYDGVNAKMNDEGGLKKLLFDRTLTVAAARRKLDQRGKSSLVLNLQHSVLDKVVAQKIRDRFGGRLRFAVSGGAALAKEVAEFIDNLGILVLEGYGLTETSPILTANLPGPGNRKIGSVGKAIPGVEIIIDPIEGVPEGEGEICARGPNIMKGYHNLPTQTAEVLSDDGLFRTGDMGRLDEDGFLWITGRVKEQYKLENGKYVVPAPLEEKLKLSPYINHIMIHGVDHPYNVAVICPDLEALKKFADKTKLSYTSDADLLAKPAVTQLIEAQLAKYATDFKGYERVKRFHLTAEEFSTENDQLTPTLKIKRRNVLAAYGDAIEALYKD